MQVVVQKATPKRKRTLIDYDANGNQTTIKEVVGTSELGSDPEQVKVQQYHWDEENRLRAVNLNPEEQNPRPV